VELVGLTPGGLFGFVVLAVESAVPLACVDVEVVVVVVVLVAFVLFVPFVLLVPLVLLLGQICVVVQMGNGFWTIHG
jgi:hypothetical protein